MLGRRAGMWEDKFRGRKSEGEEVEGMSLETWKGPDFARAC